MSKLRQSPSVVRSYSTTHPPGRVLLPTEPGWDQLVFADAGLVTAHTETTAWTIPIHRALCVPDGSRVHIQTGRRRTPIRCLYAKSDLGLVPDAVQIVSLTALTRELIHHAIITAPLNLDNPTTAALITLLADQLAASPETPLDLPLPTDPTATGLATAIMAGPNLSLEDHLRHASASRRTLERTFKSETRLSLGQWRRRARILAGVALLSNGSSVTETGFQVGYSSPSSFIAAFRSELGATPREFMRS